MNSSALSIVGDVFGRFHPLVLHLPIGLLAGLALLELRAFVTRTATPRSMFRFVAAASALFAIASAGTGLLLARSDEMTNTLYLHRALGIAVAALASTLALAARARTGEIAPRGFGLERALLAVTLLALVPAGHLGATLTHGENFLFAPFSAPTRAESSLAEAKSDGPKTLVHADIAQLLDKYCVECHGGSKKKGGLRLDTHESIEKGGKHGAVVLAGDAEKSELVLRMRIPSSDDDHMPPPEKPQPKPEEIDAIAAWVKAGARFGGEVAVVATQGKAKPSPDVKKAPDAGAIAALRERLVHVESEGEGDPLISVDFAAIAEKITDADFTALISPLADSIADLSIARTKVTDAAMTLVARMPNLERLDLRGTAITSAGLAALSKHEKLSELIVAQGRLDDAANATLLAMPALRTVHLWKSGISDDAVSKLRAARPDVAFDAGDGGPVAAAEVEPLVELGKKPEKKPIPEPVAALIAINATCPVSGAPVDANFRVVYDGKVVGFCCEKCAAKFLADPKAYAAKLQ